MSATGAFLKFTKIIKPILVRIIPIDKLRGMKASFLSRAMDKKYKKHSMRKYEPGRYPEGINLLGNIRAEIGLGQSCRLVAKELINSGLDYSISELMAPGEFRAEDHSLEDYIGEDHPYDINIIHVEPFELMQLFTDMDTAVLDYKYNIAFWLWELEEFPESWKKSIDIIDEIWTPSEFTSKCIRKVTDKPVVTIPYSVDANTEGKYSREYFGLPEDKFLFLIMYDTNSTAARKNPMGAVKAFKQAFPPEDDSVGLVVKMNNPTEEDLDNIRKEFQGYSNIYYVTEILEKVVVNSLIKAVDVFVSLHRAEGFGLVMAEAMLNGTPCIATNWSSNTEFMDEESACMIDYKMITIEETNGPYEKGGKWADADVDQTTEYMKRLASDPDYYRVKKEKALKKINETLDMNVICDKIRTRVNEIHKMKEKI